jgi:superkiller protein 3
LIVTITRALVVLTLVGVAGQAIAQQVPAGSAQSKAQAAFADGQAQLAAKHPSEAAERFEAAVAADPTFALAWYSLASTRRRMNQCDRAIPAYLRYAELHPSDPEPYYGLGICLRDIGDRAGARQALNKYLTLEKRASARQWIEHAREIISKLGEGDKPAQPPAPKPEAPAPASGSPTAATPPAPAGSTPASASASTSPPAQTSAPTLAKEQPGTTTTTPPAPAGAGAHAHATKGTGASGADAEAGSSGRGAALYTQAQSLRDRGHIDEAVAKFRQAITADPTNMVARAALGELLIKVRRDDEAIAVFRAAVEKNPAYPLSWYELAFALRVRGQHAEAVDAYQRYIKLRPSDPDPYYGLARSLQKLGRNEDARHAYETYVSMEKRPAEQRWVKSAQEQLAALAPKAP